MGSGFKVATAFVEVVPDADGFKTKLDAELKHSGAEAKVKVTADTTVVDQKISETKTRLDGISAKDAKAKVTLDTAEFDAKADRAEERLHELGGKEEHVRVKLDDGDFKSKAAEDKAAADSLGSSGQGASLGISMIGAAVAGAAMALPALGGAMAGAGAAAGVLGLSLLSVKQAMTDGIAAQQQAGQASAQLAATEFANSVAIKGAQQAIADARRQAAQQAIASAEAVRNAQMSLADAERSAAQQAISSAQGVANAEQSLQNAQISERQAQVNLTQARRDAVLQLEALNNAEKDTKLGVESAKLALEQAQLAQKNNNANAMTTALQREQSDLAVAQAQQALLEAQQRATHAAEDAHKANKLGVDNAPNVLAAKNAERLALQGIANAQQALANATRNSANSQIASAEAIKKAQQALADAQRNAANSQITSNEAVRKAVENLANTQRQQQLAAVAGGNAAAKSFAQDMANMSGAGRVFVGELLHMKDQLHGLENTAQTAFLPGLTSFLKSTQTLLPAVTGEIKTMGGILGDQFAKWGNLLRSAGVQSQIKAILEQGTQFMSILLPAITRFGSALLDMWAKGGPAVTGLAKGLSGIIDGFSGMFKAMAPAAGAIGTVLKVLGQAIGSLGAPLGQIIGALATGLAPVLTALLPGFKALAGALGTLLSGAIKAVAPLLTVVATMLTNLAKVISPVLSQIGGMLGTLGTQLAPVFAALGQAQGQFMEALKPLFGLLPVLVKAFVDFAVVAVKPLSGLITQMAPIVTKVATAFVKFISDAIKPMAPYMAQMTGLFGQILTALVPLLPPLIQLAATMGIKLLSALTPIIPMIEKFGQQLIVAMVQAIIPMLPQITQLITQMIQLGMQLAPLLPTLATLGINLLDLAVKFLPVLLPPLIQLIGLAAQITAGFLTFVTAVMGMVIPAIKAVTSTAKTLWQDVQKIFGDIWNFLKKFWNDVSATFKTATDWIYHTVWQGWIGGITSTATKLWNDLKGGVNSFWTDIKSAFSTGVSALGTIWNTIQDTFKVPVNFLIKTVYMGGIRKLWDDIVGAIGLGSLNLPSVATLNTGGIVPGPDVDHDVVPAMLTPGERVLSRTQVAQLGGHGAIDAMVGRSTGGPNDGRHFAGGGIIGDITGGLSSVVKGAGFLADFMLHPVQAVEHLLDKVVSTTAHGTYAKVMTGLPLALIHKLATYAQGAGGGAGAMAMVNLAKQQVGTSENPPGSNHQHYSSDLGRPFEAWCADFVDWVAKRSGNGGVVPMTAGAGDMAMRFGSQYKSGSTGIAPGDVVFFSGAPGGQGWGGIGHVGIAVSGGSTWQSVEGNSGDHVALNTRSSAIGYARPRYPISGGGGSAGGALGHATPQQAQAWAQQSLMGYGWGNAGEYNSLISLWNQESNWRWNALNPSSGAYGIPQSLPATKMASAGADWHDNAATQMKWGLGYIKGRYGSPSAAMAHERAYNWYDQGGWLPDGMLGRNGTGKPEAVLTPEESQAFIAIAKNLTNAGTSAASGMRPIQIIFNGQLPGPEQLAGIKHELATAIGTA